MSLSAYISKHPDCVFGGVGEKHGTCMLMKGIRPHKWKLMCDGDEGKLFR